MNKDEILQLSKTFSEEVDLKMKEYDDGYLKALSDSQQANKLL